jgi:hypothetical protein
MVNANFTQHDKEYVLKVEGETLQILSSLEASKVHETLTHAIAKVMNTDGFPSVTVEGFENSYGYADLMEIRTSMELVLFPERHDEEIVSFLEDVWNQRHG